MIQINKKTYAKLLKAKDEICDYCETGNCKDCSVTKTLNTAKEKYDNICIKNKRATTLYHIKLAIKSKYGYKPYLCIIAALNKQQAEDNLYKWFYTNQPGEKEIFPDYTEVTSLIKDKYGIVYQNLFAEDNAIYTDDNKTDKLYRIGFVIKAENNIANMCIMQAENKKQAEANLYEWLSDKLSRNHHIVYEYTKITRITEHEYGIMYQNYLKGVNQA